MSPHRLTVHHIPVCPFCQRIEILLALKGMTGRVDFRVVDVTKPRSPELLAKTRGSTSLPILETEDGRIVKESLVILRYLEDRFPDPPIESRDPWRRAVEGMMTALEGPFTDLGYRMVMNQDPLRRDGFRGELLSLYRKLDEMLTEHGTGDAFLFERFGFVETVFTPLFMRFWFLDYYEGFALPNEPGLRRVRRWRDACLSHPSAQQVTREQIVKLYYDYARGAGNGALLPGRSRSSFVFEPDWRDRPWPPKDKYGPMATDAELGLV